MTICADGGFVAFQSLCPQFDSGAVAISGGFDFTPTVRATLYVYCLLP